MATPFCNQTALMLRVSGGVPGMLGSYSGCPAVSGVQYCLLFPTESKWGNSRLLGYCLPATCTLLQIAHHVVADPMLNETFSYNRLVDSADAGASLAQYVHCTPRIAPPTEVRTENIVSWAVISFIVVIVVLATTYDYCRQITSRSIPFEVVTMGRDGAVVRVLRSPNAAAFVPRNECNGASAGTAQTTPCFSQQQKHQQQVESPVSPAILVDISQPLLTPAEQSVAREDVAGVSPSSFPPVEGIVDEVTVVVTPQPKSKPCRGYVFRHKEYHPGAAAAVEEGGGGDGHSARATTGLLPEFNTEAIWSNKRVQQFLAEMPEVPDFRSVVNRVVLCLSAINSYRKWRYYPKSEANLNLFNSWRVLAWLWIMLFNTFWYSQQIPTMENMGSRHTDFLYAFLEKEVFAGFAIGTFLVISGFLALHRLHASEVVFMSSPTARIKAAQRTSVQRVRICIVWYVKYLVSRFVRVIPVSLAVVILTPSATPSSGSGPFWTLFAHAPTMHTNCAKYWWTNFLLINNILPTDGDERCFPWSYYVALEFQLVAIAPLICFLGKHLHHRVFGALLLLAMAASAALRYVELTRQRSIPFSLSAVSHYSLPIGTVYQYPHLMFIPFCAGATLYYSYRGVRQREEMLRMFGPDILYAIHRLRNSVSAEDRVSYWLLERLQVRRVRVCAMWSGVTVMCVCVISAWTVRRDSRSGEEVGHGVKVYESLILFPWCIGLCLLALPLLFGYGGMFRRVLIHRLWCGPSRLVLVAYLMAPVVIGFGNASSYGVATMSFLLLVVQWFGYTVATLLVAFVFHILVERPCLHISSKGEY